LHGVDRLRRDLASNDAQTRFRAARRWLGEVEGGGALLPPLAALNDPDAIVPLLRAGIEAGLRARADALGRRAALQVVAGMAATPAPSLVVLLVSWRGLRLIRQVASLYGLRPGVIGTVSLLRRTALAAGATAVTEVAMNTAAHAVLSTPLLAHLAGEMAGGAVAARRMVVLARATAVACTPLPHA
jgi:putative membrane protein